jgi:hypothetical protein
MVVGLVEGNAISSECTLLVSLMVGYDKTTIVIVGR